MNPPDSIPLRSPHEKLGGYIILPRLIDKVHLQAQGHLPQEYHNNVLRQGLTSDGRFLTFMGLNAEALRQTILSANSDETVLAWVKRQAKFHTEQEKRAWAEAAIVTVLMPRWPHIGAGCITSWRRRPM
jgi:hypothetical protein